MADEAVIIELLGYPKGEPIRFTCADGTGIAKGAVLAISDPRTAALSGDEGSFAGIAAEEKTANDGVTNIGVWTKGIFDMTTDTSTPAAGTYVVTDGANKVKAEDAGDELLGDRVGKALETAASGEVIAVAVGVYA